MSAPVRVRLNHGPGIIREAADASLTSRQRGPMVRALAAAEHTGPSGQSVRYSRETLDRWIRAWQREGFDGLKPRERAAGPVTPLLSRIPNGRFGEPEDITGVVTFLLSDAASLITGHTLTIDGGYTIR